MISVGIIGGTGYTGKHLIEFCENHEMVLDYTIYGNSSAGETLYNLFPEFLGVLKDKVIESINEISFNHDLYFTAVPHGESLKYVPILSRLNKKIIDLGGDYRLDDKNLYEVWYDFKHNSPELLSEKTYGLADINNNKNYFNTDLIANPGCYPTSVLTALIPFVEHYSEYIESISCVSYSGTSGAGKKASKRMLLSEMDGNIKAYNINKHRHQPEITQELNKCGLASPLSFTTHLLPISRGIYSTSIIHLNKSINEVDPNNIYKDKFKNSPFVRIRNTPPELKWVVNTNYCDINISVDNNVVVITSAIDNLIKGAAGQAIQNMNKFYGWAEHLGILKKKVITNIDELAEV